MKSKLLNAKKINEASNNQKSRNFFLRMLSLSVIPLCIWGSSVFLNTAVARTCYARSPEISLDIGILNVAEAAPVGTLLATKNSDYSSFNCSGSGGSGDTFGITSTSPMASINYNNLQVFKTNIPGIGITLASNLACYDYNNPHGNCNGGHSGYIGLPVGDSTIDLLTYSTTSSNVDYGGGMQVNIIKTGEVADGNINETAGYWFMKNTGVIENLTISGTVNVIHSSCTVLTPSVSNSLGNHLTTDFTGMNSSTNSVDIPVKLNCPNSNIIVDTTINATPDTTTSQPGAIKLSGSNGLTAGGVAIQMLDKYGNGIPLNQSIRNQIPASGVYDFGWKAHYLQTTSAPVTSGDANASATISIDYE